METQGEVSLALEALHAKAARLAWLLEQADDPAPLLPMASGLLDDVDALRALHLRVVMQRHAAA